ncbi:TPA: prophage tail fiber N-terminal domain-containing protein [Escherichia coli]|nr:prophage tail fiber N-terminal domain-containing protein [Escherichia coli]
MSVVISGALINGAGIPMSGCHIILKSRANTSEVVMRAVADVITGGNGEYSFEAQVGKYCVYLKQDWRDEYCVGDIAVYDDSRPGTLNDFLTAFDEGDLKPDVVKRFEEMVAQAQQSAEAAAESERQAGQHAVDAQNIKDDCQTLADNVQQNAKAVAEDKKQVALLASSATQDAARAEQAVKDADTIVQKAVDKLGEAATLTGEAKGSAEAAAKSKQNAKQYRDEAQQIVDDLKETHATTTEKGLVQLCSDTDNDSEEQAATPKAVKAVMDETKTKAPLDSPAFTGTPTTPTPPDDATGLETANAAFVRRLLASLVGSAPETLDTLNELAKALGDDPNFATTMAEALAGKQPLNSALTELAGFSGFGPLPEDGVGDLLLVGGVMPGESFSTIPLEGYAANLLTKGSAERWREELGLKSAATMEPQSDIRDRTEGRLALPGAHGYGHIFKSGDALTFEGQSDFAAWLQGVDPGRYAVSIADVSGLLPGATKFNGIIDVMWSPFDNSETDTARKFKTLLCYNQYYEDEHSIHWVQYRYSGNNWNATCRLIVCDAQSLAFLLTRTSGESTSGSYKYPQVAVPIIAVYLGEEDGDENIRLGFGDIVSGDRLGIVNFYGTITSDGYTDSTVKARLYAGANYTLPGAYMSLSGSRGLRSSYGRIGLFVRTD